MFTRNGWVLLPWEPQFYGQLVGETFINEVDAFGKVLGVP